MLGLNTTPPKVGETIWLFCTLDSVGLNAKLLAAKVTFSSNKILKYDFSKGVPFQGTSGCPLINSQKQVVGVNVCGHSMAGVAVPLGTIYASLKKVKY